MDSSEVYLDLRGPGGVKVEGDVAASGYEQQIALYDWDWGVSLEEVSAKGNVQETQTKSKEFSLSKVVDAASMTMMSYLHSGEVCEKAIITLAQRLEKNIMLRLILRNVRLMSCDLRVDSDGQEVVMEEEWTLSFQEIEVMYKGAEQTQDVRGKVSNSTLRSTSSFKLTVPPGTQFDAKPKKEAPNKRRKGGGAEAGADKDKAAIDADAVAKAVEAHLAKQGKR